MKDKKHELRSRSELIDCRQSLRFDLLEIRDSSTPLRIVPREEGHSPALQSGEISEEQQRRNIEGVGQLVAQVLSQ